jgi:hypothetical protein
MLSTTLVRDTATRLVFLNEVAWGAGGLVVPLASFGVLLAGYGLIAGFAGRAAALGRTRYGERPLLAAVGVLPIIAYSWMASFLGRGGISLGILAPVGRGSWGRASVLSALAVLFSIAFVVLLLPLVLRAPGHTTQRARRAALLR